MAPRKARGSTEGRSHSVGGRPPAPAGVLVFLRRGGRAGRGGGGGGGARGRGGGGGGAPPHMGGGGGGGGDKKNARDTGKQPESGAPLRAPPLACEAKGA